MKPNARNGGRWKRHLKWTLQKNFSIIALPVISYTPETDLTIGATVQFFFRPKKTPQSHLSSIFLGGYYTLNKQYQFFTRYEIFLKEDKLWFDGEFKYQNWLEEFYGIGNETKYKDREIINYQQWYWDFRILFRLKNFYLGPQIRISRLWDTSYASDSTILSETDVIGKDGYYTMGVGLALAWDTRDNNIFPLTGHYIQLSNLNHPKWRSGAQFKFFNVEFDYRQFFNPRKGKHVIAIRGYLLFNPGDPPFRLMSLHGGQYHGRGYYEGRYRDRHMWSTQFEWRFPIFWRIRGEIFGSLGDVGHTVGDWSFKTIKWGAGFGIRFVMNKKERTSIRFDYGFGQTENDRGAYFGANEVF